MNSLTGSTGAAGSPDGHQASLRSHERGLAHAGLPWYMAAGLMGANIGTSVFVGTGLLVPVVGFAAPLFVLLVVATMWLFKSTFQEGCSVNPVNGGAYSLVLSTIGRRSGLAIGSLTTLFYLVTAVVSSLAGAYSLSHLWGGDWPGWALIAVAAVPIVLFGLLNIQGLTESTRVVFVIAVFHFAMLIVMDIWGLWIAVVQGAHWERLWTGLGGLAPHAWLIGFAYSFLVISGFELVSQVVEELEKPVSVAVKRIYTAIVALVAITAPLSSMLAICLLSEQQIQSLGGNLLLGQAPGGSLLSGLALVEGGQAWLVLLVVNTSLTFFAAVMSAYAGATGLMNTFSQLGNLPHIVLQRWIDRYPGLRGYPYICLPLMGVSLVMVVIFSSTLASLWMIYLMTFIGVMFAYCLGVLLTRLYHEGKVERAQFLRRLTFTWHNRDIPVAPVVGGLLLLVAELTLVLTEHEARTLGAQLFLGVILILGMYRLGVIENRMVQVPDLRLGMGRLRGRPVLPEDLPRLIVCIKEFNPEQVVNILAYVLKRHASAGPLEIVLFHAQTAEEPTEDLDKLSRVISQQLEEFEFFSKSDFVLTVKVLPGNLIEVLPEYFRTSPFTMAYMCTGPDSTESERLCEHLSNEIELNVIRLDEEAIPKGPGVWFRQWMVERSAGLGRGEAERELS